MIHIFTKSLTFTFRGWSSSKTFSTNSSNHAIFANPLTNNYYSIKTFPFLAHTMSNNCLWTVVQIDPRVKRNKTRRILAEESVCSKLKRPVLSTSRKPASLSIAEFGALTNCGRVEQREREREGQSLQGSLWRIKVQSIIPGRVWASCKRFWTCCGQD